MTSNEILSVMTAAAADRSIVTGEQVNQLRALAGFDAEKALNGWTGTVDAANVEWMVERARRRGA